RSPYFSRPRALGPGWGSRDRFATISGADVPPPARDERRCELSEEGRRVARGREPDVRGRRAAFGHLAGAEDQIPDEHLLAVVGVRSREGPRVVPAVDLGHGEDVVERAESDVDVRVLEERVGGREDAEEREERGLGAEDDERSQIDEGREPGVER